MHGTMPSTWTAGAISQLTLVVCMGACLFLGSTAAATSDPSGGKAAKLLACLPKEADCLNKRTVWDHMLQHVPPCIAGKRVWWSAHTPRLPVTLVTQLSANRIPALQAQCLSWPGPLAAAIFLPLFNPGPLGVKELSDKCKMSISKAEASIQELMTWADDMAAQTKDNADQLVAGQSRKDFFKGMPQNYTVHSRPRASCQLRVILIYEIYAQEKAMALYPVNSLRNYARLLADTPLIANIDVDMLPSFSLSAALLRGWQPGTTAAAAAAAATRSPPAAGSAADLLLHVTKEKAVFVLPAFETICGGPILADQVSAYNKPQIQTIMAENCTIIFRYLKAPQLHNATDFPRWFSLPSEPTPGASSYRIQYEDSFEPWFIGARDQTEWFDVRYRGYGKNKIQQVAHQAHRAAVFYVHPTGFIIHRPHDQSEARKTFLRVKFKARHNPNLLQDSLYQHVEDMWERHAQEIKEGKFQALIDDTLAACITKLPWWKDLYPLV